ncbi:hypothetical protein MCC93_18490 [Morococcus cerebrosus]|uniref:Uncharacterized protein n=1 Tax=Morococcus cerebrosus TaxID=1056807 RepID=A0A0C1GY43_9NEIS|nr:hypothetical protein MCC93_18490 [Morococcus cerebrosus]
MSEFKRENGLYHCNRKGRLKRNQETLSDDLIFSRLDQA